VHRPPSFAPPGGSAKRNGILGAWIHWLSSDRSEILPCIAHAAAAAAAKALSAARMQTEPSGS